MPDKHNREFEGIRHDLEKLTARLADLAGDGLDDAQEMGREKLSQLGGTIKDAAGAVRDKASEVDDFVRENPWQIIIGAALLGAAVGVLIQKTRD